MKQEDRQLLLKDLSARLPYNPMVHIHELGGIDYENYLYADDLDRMMSYSITLKPYLRPLSSMTKEEKREFESFGWRVDELDNNYPWAHTGEIKNILLGLNWLNARHFDYRSLIPMGLAIEAPEEMYK